MHPDEWEDFIKVDDNSLEKAWQYIEEYCIYVEAKNIGQLPELDIKQIKLFNIINEKLNDLRTTDGKRH